MDLLSLVLIGNTEDFDPVTLSFYECLGNLLQPQKKKRYSSVWQVASAYLRTSHFSDLRIPRGFHYSLSILSTHPCPALSSTQKHGRHKWIANIPQSTVVITMPQPKGGTVSIFKRTVALRGSSFEKYETKLPGGHQNVLGVFVLGKMVVLTWTEHPCETERPVATGADPERTRQPQEELDLSAQNKRAPHSSTRSVQLQKGVHRVSMPMEKCPGRTPQILT